MTPYELQLAAARQAGYRTTEELIEMQMYGGRTLKELAELQRKTICNTSQYPSAEPQPDKNT